MPTAQEEASKAENLEFKRKLKERNKADFKAITTGTSGCRVF